MTEENKKERIKRHFLENKKFYLGLGIGVAVSASVTAIVVLKNAGFQVPEVQQNAKNVALIVWKSPPTNIALVKNACPDPIPVRDKLTGEVYCSIRRAAAMTGKNAREISKDANGAQELFERLPDSVFA